MNAADMIAEARALVRAEEYDRALDLCREAAKDPAQTDEAMYVLSALAFHFGDIAQAAQMLRPYAEHADGDPDTPEVLAVLHAMAGAITDALYYGKVATVRPQRGRLLELFGADFPKFSDIFKKIPEKPLMRLGRQSLDTGDTDVAIAFFGQHLSFFPNDPDGLAALAEAHAAAGQLTDAANILRSLRALLPLRADHASRLGQLLTRAGQLAEARACHILAAGLEPDSAAAAAAYLADMAFDPQAGAADAAAVFARLQHLVPAVPRHGTVDAEREPLIIGYLVGHLSAVEGLRVAQVMRKHQRGKVRVIGYGRGPLSQPHNLPYRTAVDEWRDLSGLDEETAAMVLRGDEIDVLVDCNGLRATELLALVARRAAPVQVAWPQDAGEATAPGIDYRLGGPKADGLTPAWPIGGLDFTALPDELADARPGSRGDELLFAADAELSQLNPTLAAAWARILLALPQAKLLLVDRGLSAADALGRLIDLFGSLGIAHRVDVVQQAERRDIFLQAQVVLMPFPVADRAAALDAVLAGAAPVVLAPPQTWTSTGRVAEMLAELGGAALVADSLDAYVGHAVALGRAPERAQALATDMAAAARSSGALGTERLARSLEESFRAMLRAAV